MSKTSNSMLNNALKHLLSDCSPTEFERPRKHARTNSHQTRRELVPFIQQDLHADNSPSSDTTPSKTDSKTQAWETRKSQLLQELEKKRGLMLRAEGYIRRKTEENWKGGEVDIVRIAERDDEVEEEVVEVIREVVGGSMGKSKSSEVEQEKEIMGDAERERGAEEKMKQQVVWDEDIRMLKAKDREAAQKAEQCGKGNMQSSSQDAFAPRKNDAAGSQPSNPELDATLNHAQRHLEHTNDWSSRINCESVGGGYTEEEADVSEVRYSSFEVYGDDTDDDTLGHEHDAFLAGLSEEGRKILAGDTADFCKPLPDQELGMEEEEGQVTRFKAAQNAPPPRASSSLTRACAPENLASENLALQSSPSSRALSIIAEEATATATSFGDYSYVGSDDDDDDSSDTASLRDCSVDDFERFGPYEVDLDEVDLDEVLESMRGGFNCSVWQEEE